MLWLDTIQRVFRISVLFIKYKLGHIALERRKSCINLSKLCAKISTSARMHSCQNLRDLSKIGVNPAEMESLMRD